MSCISPISFEQLVEYWTSELDAAAVAAIEDHVFACDTCAAQLERVQRLVAVFRDGLPPVISPEQLRELRQKGLALVENDFVAGHRTEVAFTQAADLLIHHLTGLPLADASRVSVTVRSESTGMVIHEEPFAPFDRERGEVLIACQRHFAAFPRDIVFDVRVHAASRSAPTIATYSIPHVFAG